jgi:hypothetical protein
MAYVTPYTFVALQTLTAAQLNAIQTNITALWPYSAAGDLAYASSASVLARLAKGTAGQALKMNAGATAPEWGSGGGASNRQGGSATDWSSPGSTDYVPAGSKIQCGETQIVISGAGSGSVSVTFPVAFANDSPIILAVISKIASGGISGGVTSGPRADVLSKSAMTLGVSLGGSSTVTLNISWIAIGE